MKKSYNLHSLSDLVSLAKYVQCRVYWGGYFIRMDDEQSYRWKDFWDHVEDDINNGHINQIVIHEDDQFVEFI